MNVVRLCRFQLQDQSSDKKFQKSGLQMSGLFEMPTATDESSRQAPGFMPEALNQVVGGSTGP